MTIKQTLISLAFIGIHLLGSLSQAQQAYLPPLDIPLLLSGTFAELRSNHFHSGIDLRTQGVEGLKVYASEDGYVSRISIAPGGFGKALYIDHPLTGHTSVYAHLKGFNKAIDRYVKGEQYKAEQFTVNLTPEPGRFPVKKGEVVGLSGNSGSSGGPHLHFEIRDTKTQKPLNPAKFGFKIKDFIRPAITKLAVYPADSQAYVNGSYKMQIFEVQGWGEQHYIKDKLKVKASGLISFGIGTFDTHNDTPNKNGVYAVELYVDSAKVFGFRADQFSFDESRFINSFIDYAFLIKHKSRLIRSDIDPLNKLSLYDERQNMGVFYVSDTATHLAFYKVTDHFGNISYLNFTIEGSSTIKSPKENTSLSDRNHFVKADQAVRLELKDVVVRIPAEAFYRDQNLLFDSRSNVAYLSDIITLGENTIPVHKAIELSIKVRPGHISASKMLIALLEKGKSPQFAGNGLKEGFVTASIRTLGEYALMADTIAPTIKPLNFKSGTPIGSLKQIRISIQDDFSGIATYQPSLNGQWLLMDYDAKNNLLVYDFDERLQKGVNSFELKVTDKSGNVTVFKSKLDY
jgi:hypothetical protein